MCTQPFNKNFKYGLSFISIYSVEEKPAILTPATTKNEMKLGAFRLKSEEETKFKAPKNGMSLLFKAKTSPIKDSVAATIRAKETLASIAVHSLESEKKRKASGDHQIHQTKKRRKSPERTQSQDKANRQKTPKPEQNLPRRNLLNFEKPDPEKTTNPEHEKTKKTEPE